ncbi:MAG TPA: sugar ABC transporter ATP-binding protein [Anaerolineaceae bacterium]|nr:sugar ABC transporter ATP-binding protein [Anaerolineaceae bacterium]
MIASDSPSVIQMQDIVKNFPGVRALDHVNFELKRGELRSLVGKNGAGKSTLMNVLTGIYQPDQGNIIVNGESIHPMTTERARQLGIAYVHQHSQLVPALSIAENIFLGSPLTHNGGFVDWKQLIAEASKQLKTLGLGIDVERKVEDLTVAEKQIIEIAKALFAKAHTIILDEATAPLPKEEVNMLFDFVRLQGEQGVAFVYISHYLEEVFELCEAVTVMRDGQIVGDYKVCDLDQSELIRLISGARVEQFHRESHKTHRKPALEVQGLTRPGFYKDIHLTICEGEVVGLTGLEGCGKANLGRGLYSLEPRGNGKVLLCGTPFSPSEPEQALNAGVAYLPRDRHGMGIVGIRPVGENITLSILRRLINRFGLLETSKERSHISYYVQKLGIKTTSVNQPVDFLSGGNQQKVVFAKLVSTQPKVLFLDEPTQGVDVQAKVEIMKIVDQLAEQGVAIVYISEEIREMLDICDRILVMYNGEISTEFKAGDPNYSADQILMAVEGERVVL